jgi:serine phosphatase RsbU (regulator of sigma subunit)
MPDSALIYQQKAIKEAVKAKAPRYHTLALLGVAKIYYAQAKYRQAVKIGQQALAIAYTMTSLDVMRDAQEILYQSYQRLQNYKAAFEAHLKYTKLQDSLLNTSRVKELTMLEMNYDFDKKQALIEAKQKAKEERLKIENEKKLAQQRLYLLAVLGVLGTVVLFSVFVLRSRQVQKKLNVQLTEQKDDLQQKQNELVVLNEELHQSRDEVITQRDYIEEQHKDLVINKDRIDSSIRAAQTIQQAVLPFADELKQAFAEYFIIYRPKDVVSGDFYWVKQLPTQTIVVVADCTGHGVPGAFMSLIGINLLDKIIFQENITQPADILNRLHGLINIALHQENVEHRSGGMDAVVLCLQPTSHHHNTHIVFSGARNPLYYKAPDMPEIQLLLGTRKSVGGYHNDTNAFTASQITLPQGSTLYAGSDGFQDQNNAHRKKFGSKQLLKLLNLVVDKPLPKQKAILESELNDHMQGTSQRDDIVWLGIKL